MAVKAPNQRWGDKEFEPRSKNRKPAGGREWNRMWAGAGRGHFILGGCSGKTYVTLLARYLTQSSDHKS